MRDPLERLAGLAPRVDHAAALQAFDHRRRRRQRRRLLAVAAAVAVVALTGTVATFALISRDDGTSVSAADGGRSPTNTKPAPFVEPSVRVVDGSSEDVGATVANALIACGFDVTMATSTTPVPETGVTATEDYVVLGRTVADVVGAGPATIATDPVLDGDGADIVVALGPSYDPARLDTSPCPIASLYPVAGPPPPGTPPLFSVEGPGPNGATVVIADVYASQVVGGTPRSICVAFATGSISCGDGGGELPSVVGGTYGRGRSFVAVIGPPTATAMRAETDIGPFNADTYPIPDTVDLTGTVAVIELTGAYRVDELVAFDSDGKVVARNRSQVLGSINRSLIRGAPTCGPGLPAAPSADASPVLPKPDPGDSEAVLPGQTVVHWTDGPARFELRWPPTPQPHYGLDAPLLPGFTAFTSGRGLEVDLSGGGLTDRHVDLVLTDTTPDTPACAAVQLDYWVDGEHTRVGLRLTADPTQPVEHLDLGPVVTSRRTDPPDEVVACSNDAIANRSATAPATGYPTAVDALVAFLDTDAVTPPLPRSGWTEFGDGTELVYGWETEPGSDRYATLVGIVQDTNGWTVDWWKASGC